MNPIPGDPITIETGKLSGTLLDSGVKAYFGVPFAAPPVRELRWHEPIVSSTDSEPVGDESAAEVMP